MCRILAALLTLVFCQPGLAADRPSIYPFDVIIGGQTALAAGEVFAKIEKPCPADSKIEIPNATGMTIINIFPLNPDGSIPDDAQEKTKIILIQSGTSALLTDTMDKSTLAPGHYGANVVSGERTSRVQFTVK